VRGMKYVDVHILRRYV